MKTNIYTVFLCSLFFTAVGSTALHAQEMPSKKKDLEAAYTAHTTEISTLKEKNSQLEAKISNLEADIRKLGYEKEGLLEDLNSLDNQLLELKKSETSLKAALTETQNELEINKGINMQLKSMLSSLTAAQQANGDPNATQTSVTQLNGNNVPYYLGSFMGTAPESVVKDENGKDMVINGQKIKTPPIAHTFTFTPDQKVMLEQVNEHDQSVKQLAGTYQVIQDDAQHYEISCTVNDGSDISLTYTISIDKASQTTRCSLSNQTPFELLKNTLVENIGQITTE
ncbi:hypothetical protein [Echinicola vietnamensis]|uniref:Uncharacterized protein n=1 Tax=Echinicola vietnamensis (strain DSM 17526 / LMG 23754 / KMM 6221) TaxID=926556 RepID=L0FTH2_ECHVK|nr:hypothetical protein [Echinicola vietnamensis]AGA76587.1 hypothetical protein Echvi_0296 [Echinicola vietnamensis DSM 17526]